MSEIILEQEVFVDPVITAPNETAGTKSLAETVLPFVRVHNTVLLENRVVICWADSVTHADSCAEVLETYCRTLIPASQLGKPICRIPPKTIAELLDKKHFDLSGARLPHLEQSCAASPSRDKKRKTSYIARARASKVQRDEAFKSLVIYINDEVLRFASGKEE